MAKTQMRKLVSGLLIAAGLLGLANQAHAVWTFTSATAVNKDAADVALNSFSGIYASNNASNVVTGNWTAGTLNSYPGLGMSTGGESGAPYHALDNNGNTEAVLLNFASSVVLSSIGLSYATSNTSTQASGPVDISLFRWTGAGTPAGNTVDKLANTHAGWELVGNYGEMAVDTNAPYNAVNSSGKGSSWWMISAYNSGFTNSGGNFGSLDNGNDYFKLSALAGSKCTAAGQCGSSDTPRVPEPGSLALAGLALFGVVYTRRQSKARQA